MLSNGMLASPVYLTNVLVNSANKCLWGSFWKLVTQTEATMDVFIIVSEFNIIQMLE